MDIRSKENLQSIIYLSVIFSGAFLYATVTGLPEGISAGCILSDTLIFGGIYYLAGTGLKNIICHGFPYTHRVSLRTLLIFSICIFISVCAIGLESLVMYNWPVNNFSGYTSTLLTRVFISILFSVILYQHESLQKTEQKPETEENLPEEIQKSREIIEHITVRTGQNIKMILLKDVEFIKADGDYVSIVTKDGQWLKEQTMKHFEEHLPAKDFIRTHRSYIVGINHISRIQRYGQMQQIELKSGQKIKLSATGYKMLKLRLGL